MSHQDVDGPAEVQISLPGEWVFKKLLGPTFNTIGEDINRLYVAGRDKILTAAQRKTDNLDDGKTANLRVARDVLWNGAFTDDEISAEYFGGILAASRTEDGKDDSAVPFLDVVKSLSSDQLRLHYYIYHGLSSLLLKLGEISTPEALLGKRVFVVWVPKGQIGDAHLAVLHQRGLISAYELSTKIIETIDGERALPYVSAQPTWFGTALYAAGHNKLDWWQAFGLKEFGNFNDVQLPLSALTLEDLIGAAKNEDVLCVGSP